MKVYCYRRTCSVNTPHIGVGRVPKLKQLDIPLTLTVLLPRIQRHNTGTTPAKFKVKFVVGLKSRNYR